jgi:thioredoxin reductase
MDASLFVTQLGSVSGQVGDDRRERIDVRTHTEVVGLEADTRLRGVVLSSHDEAGVTRLPMDSLFVCIGGVPRTRGLAAKGLAIDDAGFLLTGADVTAGLRRIYEYCFPLEDRRAREAYGVPSGVNNILIINRPIAPSRISAILVRQSIGF